MKKFLFSLVTLVVSLTSMATDYDQNKPFGFCTVSSRTDASKTYDITGGGCYTYPIPDDFTGKVTILKSNGQDMKSAIQNAIKQFDVIIFDGSNGDFIVSSNIGFERGNKTLLGINNARLCTKWHMTDEIKAALDEAGVPSMSTSSGGGTLPNGQYVKEQAEYNTRLIIINLTGDNNENYRKSGIFSLNKENVIIRNLTLVGPGSVDVGGYDLISATGAKHCWVDHCAFIDGMDGNFDITNSSDFFTVSWCTFSYTDRSYMHQNTNLIGSSDSETQGYLNTTFAFNWWGKGCKQRMPMARVGKVHMLNNYFSSTTASNGINPRINSEFLIDGNYFDTGMKKYYTDNDSKAVTWTANNFIAESRTLPASKGSTVTVPYDYSAAPYSEVPATVKENAGATLPYTKGGDDPGPITVKIYTVMFNGEDAQSTEGYFSFGDGSNKHNFNSKFTGKYNGVEYTQGLKMEGSTLIQFTNVGTATVKIVQSDWESADVPHGTPKSLKFDGQELDVSAATRPEGSEGVLLYTIEGVNAGTHQITRGSGESGVFFVEVSDATTSAIKAVASSATVTAVEYYSLDGRRLSEPQHGINIRVERMSNGQSTTKKVIR